MRLTTAVGASLDETDTYVRRAETFLEGRPEVLNVMSNVGPGSGSLSVTMVPPGQRKLTQCQFSALMRKEFSSYPGLRASVQDLSQQGFGGTKGYPVEFSVRGSDWNTLVGLAMKMKADAASSGFVTDIDSDYQLGAPELVVTPDRARATDLGIAITDVANTVSALVGGVVIGQYSEGGRRMDMRVRLTASQRSRPEDLSTLRVRTSSAALVPLSSVVTMHEQAELQQINHADRERAITITGNVAAGKAQGDALAYVQTIAASAPPGYRVVLGGQSSQFGDAMSSLLFALMIGILFAYMVLASQFNSFMHPVTVLTILPLSVAGAMFALFIANKTLNIFSMIGLLLLMGIVKKNSIILVDYANEVREREHLDAHTAMLRAGPVRLRPILMTAVATMMAAVPSAMGFGPGSETRGPMADAVIGGLVLSTALSLLVVPAFYVVSPIAFAGFRKRSVAAAHEGRGDGESKGEEWQAGKRDPRRDGRPNLDSVRLATSRGLGHRVHMTQSGARGPGSPPKPPPAPANKGVPPRAAPTAPAKGVSPASPVAPARPLAPAAPAAPRWHPRPRRFLPRPSRRRLPRQPSSPEHPQAPTPPWRSVPDANAPRPGARRGDPGNSPVPRLRPRSQRRAAAKPAAIAPAAAAPAPLTATPVAAVPVMAPPPAAQVTPPQAPVAVAPPPLPPPEPALSRAPAHDSSAEPREDPRRIARAAVDEALAPVQQTVRELLRRIEELERRPAQTVTHVAAQAAAPPAVSHAAPSPAMAAPYRQPQPSYSSAMAAEVPVVMGSLAPRPPVYDVKAIERDTNIEVDGAIDGRKRKRRLAITFVLLLLAIFGALFGALAYSYSPHQSMADAPAGSLRA